MKVEQSLEVARLLGSCLLLLETRLVEAAEVAIQKSELELEQVVLLGATLLRTAHSMVLGAE